MKSEETPSKEGILKVPIVQLSTTSLSTKISTIMSHDLLRASLILHQAPQGSVTFPNDP
jgi:hypothetical protein